MLADFLAFAPGALTPLSGSPDLVAAVHFYGGQPAVEDVSNVKTPLLAHYAGLVTYHRLLQQEVALSALYHQYDDLYLRLNKGTPSPIYRR